MILSIKIKDDNLFKEEAVLSFEANSTEESSNVFEVKTSDKTYYLLKLVGIWGANGVGKTIYLRVLEYFGTNPLKNSNVEIKYLDDNYKFNTLTFTNGKVIIWSCEGNTEKSIIGVDAYYKIKSTIPVWFLDKYKSLLQHINFENIEEMTRIGYLFGKVINHKVVSFTTEDTNNSDFDLMLHLENGTQMSLYECFPGTITHVLEIIIFLCTHKNHTLVVDDYLNHLHPKLVKYLFSLFQSEEYNNNNQLLFTSHQPYLMNKSSIDCHSLRSEQIYLMDKVNDNVELYSIADFENVNENVDFGDWYLAGKFGALPKIYKYI